MLSVTILSVIWLVFLWVVAQDRAAGGAHLVQATDGRVVGCVAQEIWLRARFDPEYLGVRLPGTESSGFEQREVNESLLPLRPAVRALYDGEVRRADEKPPEDHWKRRFPELEQKLLDEYYKYKGWNSEGIPTAASLRELELDYVLEDFLARGILTEDSSMSPGGDGGAGAKVLCGEEGAVVRVGQLL